MNDKDTYEDIHAKLKFGIDQLYEAVAMTEDLEDPKLYPIIRKDTGDTVGHANLATMIREAIYTLTMAKDYADKEVYGE